VPIGETVRSFREILDGKHDDLPEGAFLLKGSIDDVVSSVKGDSDSDSGSDDSDEGRDEDEGREEDETRDESSDDEKDEE